MPQLIPDPWFFIFVSSWLILTFLAPQKILKHNTLNDPATKSTKISHHTWSWPWS
uniref:ATP synthase complex subunit 8 n=2 Tax=Scaphiophryne TaxID=68437 RepID=A0A343VTI4_9NEOB|nr:ATP synthase F0 subunit 8 [Scaphiophryne madagascariensis]AVP25700.1 ATP synthase subunit 8 [Scaphiophryne sp. TNHC-GDC 14371]